jgi:hypothetical protein
MPACKHQPPSVNHHKSPRRHDVSMRFRCAKSTYVIVTKGRHSTRATTHQSLTCISQIEMHATRVHAQALSNPLRWRTSRLSGMNTITWLPREKNLLCGENPQRYAVDASGRRIAFIRERANGSGYRICMFPGRPHDRGVEGHVATERIALKLATRWLAHHLR